MMTHDPKTLQILGTASIKESLSVIDQGGLGLALIVDESERLVQTVTDGDLRRALLAGLPLSSPVSDAKQHTPTHARRALTTPATTKASEVLRLMLEYDVRHIPRLDPEGRVVDVVTLGDLAQDARNRPLGVDAVVMAGGLGKRLRPLTDHLPKPMLPVGGRPLLETTVGRLRDAGISRCWLTTHYLRNIISDHFGDGSDFGVDIQYVEEDSPLGTAGALRHVEGDEPLLIMNGDVVTGIDFQALVRFHREQKADITIGVRPHHTTIPFGVVEIKGTHIRAITEKPSFAHFINAGIYMLAPKIRELIPDTGACDMPDLIQRALSSGCTVAGFPIAEYWQDIGQAQDYEKAQNDWELGQIHSKQSEEAKIV